MTASGSTGGIYVTGKHSLVEIAVHRFKERVNIHIIPVNRTFHRSDFGAAELMRLIAIHESAKEA